MSRISVSLPYQKLTRTEDSQISTVIATAYQAALPLNFHIHRQAH